jgi:hypothetical protein
MPHIDRQMPEKPPDIIILFYIETLEIQNFAGGAIPRNFCLLQQIASVKPSVHLFLTY